jgi:hypothetical protein
LIWGTDRTLIPDVTIGFAPAGVPQRKLDIMIAAVEKMLPFEAALLPAYAPSSSRHNAFYFGAALSATD